MLKLISYITVASLSFFGFFLSLSIWLNKIFLGYISEFFLLVGLFTGIFGVLFPILFRGVYENVLSERQKKTVSHNVILDFMLRLSSAEKNKKN